MNLHVHHLKKRSQRSQLFNYCLAADFKILGFLSIEQSVSHKLAINNESAFVEPKLMELCRFHR
jgi:hypothetical protein